MQFRTDYSEKKERDTFYAALFGAWEGENSADRDAIVRMMNRAYKPFQEWFLTYSIGRVRGRVCCQSDLEDRIDWVARYAYRIDIRDFERIVEVMIPILRGERAVSADLRRALCESVAILAGHESRFTQRSDAHIDSFADKIVHYVLGDMDPVIWKDLAWKIPLLAEASPPVFLSILTSNKDKIPELNKELNSGTDPLNLNMLLVSVLSSLFWYDEYAVDAAKSFAYLCRLNDPVQIDLNVVRALVAIISPRQPLTHAEYVTQFRAMQAVLEADREFGWAVLLEILIERHEKVFSIASPKFDPRHTFRSKPVNDIQFRERMHMYILLALKQCETDGTLFADLARLLDLVKPQMFEMLFDIFTPEQIEKLNLNAEARYMLWDRLSDFSERNHMIDTPTEHLTHHQLRTIDKMVKHLTPEDPVLQTKRLFKYDEEFLIYRYLEEYTIDTALFDERRKAVKNLYKHGGKEAVLELARTVDQPTLVGNIAASLDHIDGKELGLQELLDSMETSEASFAEGFYEVRAR